MGYEDESHGCDYSSTPTRQLTAELVRVISAFEKRILPARPAHNQAISEYGDNVYAVPVIISLRDHHPKRRSLKPGHEWTREDTRFALNAVDTGLGDRFVARG